MARRVVLLPSASIVALASVLTVILSAVAAPILSELSIAQTVAKRFTIWLPSLLKATKPKPSTLRKAPVRASRARTSQPWQNNNWHAMGSDTTQPETRSGLPTDSTLQPAHSLKALQLDSAAKQANLMRADSGFASVIDSLLATPFDSTARLEQFLYRRKGKPTIEINEPFLSPLFLPQSALKREVSLDSLGQFITISEKVDGYEVRPKLRVPLEMYKKLRFEASLRQNFREIAGQQFKLQSQDVFSDVLGRITRLQILVPGGESSFFATLFGPPTVSLQVAGNIDIRAGVELEDSKDPQRIAIGAGRRADPRFDQQVQFNLSGLIGDKLNLTADWNTQRPFEFENQLKLGYRGYEDDIVQSIEAGNVALTLPTSLIGSSQALFGIKAKAQLAGLGLTAVASQQRGRSDALSISGGSQETVINLQAWEYDILRHFFISNFYATNWDKAFSTQLPQVIVPQDQEGRQLGRVEVWRLPEQGAQQFPERRAAVALFNYGDEPYDARKLEDGVGFAFPRPRYYDVPEAQSEATLNRFRNADTLETLPVGQGIVGEFILLREGEDYTIDRRLGYISFRSPVNDGDAIAVAYQFARQGVPPVQIGDFSNDPPRRRLVLKLIKPPQLTSSNQGAWLLMLKNIYSLRTQNILPENFSLKVLYSVPGNVPPEQENLPIPGSGFLISLLGLDRFNPNNVPTSDQLFDFIPGLTIDPQRGLIIFPHLRPFDKQIRDELRRLGRLDAAGNFTNPADSNFVYQEIYFNQQRPTASDAGTKNRYIIRAKFSGGIQNPLQIGFNLAQGSVRVLSNGQPLTEGVDFTVDYQLGQVQILRPELLSPGANLRVEYERNDIVLLAARTILGTRAEYVFNENFKLGGTFLQYAERPLADKVRVGDEPIFNRIYGFDMQFKSDLPWLTRLIDDLPLLSTREPSELTLNAEFAQVLPGTPSELQTSIDPDGVSFIDDFEGSRQNLTLGLESNLWTLASPPANIPNPTLFQDSVRQTQRAYLSWYRLPQGDPRNVPTNVIFPNRRAAREELQQRPFFLEYFPRRRGQYNFSLGFLRQAQTTRPDSAWAGVMRFFPQFVRNIQDANVEFIEFWFKYEALETGAGNDIGNLYLDLGIISEDVIPNGRLNTEDGMPISSDPNGQNDNPNDIGRDAYGRFLINTSPARVNGVINTGDVGTEDVGLDGISDALERQIHSAFINGAREILGANNPEFLRLQEDPAADNFSGTDIRVLDRVANPEGNSSAQGALVGTKILPDTEDLNGNQTTDRQNSFYRYTIPINPNELRQGRGQFVVGGGERNGGWVQFRIPLQAFTKRVGDIGDFRNIAYARLWLDGFRQAARIGLATFDFVGSQWRRTDSLSAIASINVEENSAVYAIPPGAQRARNLQRPDQNILANEQSLVIIGRNITPGSVRSGFRNFALGGQGTGFNLNPYRRLRAFLHADARGIIYNPNNPLDPNNTQAIIRFGDDIEQNYYEYRIPVKPSPSVVVPELNSPDYEAVARQVWPRENEIDIDLQALAALKLRARDTLRQIKERLPNGHEIVIQGNPTLGNVRFFLVGIRNPAPVTIDTAVIWINELRVSGYNQEAGWAVRTNATLKLADFASLSATFSRRTADFHAIDVRLNQLAAQNNSLDWALSGNVNLHKFLPAEAGWSIPITFARAEQFAEPKFQPGQFDIQLQAAIDRIVADTLERGATQEQARAFGEEIRRQAQTFSTTMQFGIPRVQKNQPSDFWLARLTIDRIALGYNFTQTNSRSAVQEFNNSWSWSASAEYSLPIASEGSFFIEPLRFLEKVPILNVYKDWKFYYLPQSVGTSLALQRSRAQFQNRGQSPSTPNALFSATRTLNIDYSKITETFGMRYSSVIGSNLFSAVFNVADTTERSESEVWNRVLQDLSRFTLGRDQTYNQNLTFDWRPKLIEILDWLNLNFNYTAQYTWQNPQPDAIQPLGNVTSSTGNFSVSASLNIRSLINKFSGTRSSGGYYQNPLGQPAFGALAIESAPQDSAAVSLGTLLSGLGSVLKVLTNFDQISIRYSQTNNFRNAGVAGGAGFFNFFPFNLGQRTDVPAPPSLAYQLGLSNDPGERLRLEPVGNTVLTFPDAFTKSTNIAAQTTWNIAENFRVDINFQSNWTDNQNRIINSATGIITQDDFSGSQTLSFVALFKGIESFAEQIPRDSVGGFLSDNARLAKAFQRGFEMFSLGQTLGGLFGMDDLSISRFPLPNWRISWTGLENFFFLRDLFASATLEHAYSATFTTNYTEPTGNERQVLNSTVTEQLSPLVGLSVQWKFGMTTAISYGTSRSLSLLLANNTLDQTTSASLSLTMSFQKQGLKIPLEFWPFNGAVLENTLDLSFNLTLADEERQQITFPAGAREPRLNQGVGTVRFNFEPRIGYALSSRVNASFFWRYSRITPKASGGQIFESVRQDIGFNFRIGIGN
ncbi:MAG: cell surface protein SprA [Candidatus Thermochlorobacter sp.]